jgi:hypothetical protein
MACTPRARSPGFGRCNRLLLALGDARRSLDQAFFVAMERLLTIQSVVLDRSLAPSITQEIDDCVVTHHRVSRPRLLRRCI